MSIKEIWKPIKEYELLYEISNTGKVRSKTKELKQFLVGKYYVVSLCKNGKSKQHYIHRLVAEAFIPNVDNKPQVNHINGIKTDNRVENLEWCNNSENMQHAIKTGLWKSPKKRKKVNK